MTDSNEPRESIRLMIPCPNTGRPVYTGFTETAESFASSEYRSTEMGQCPECGARHVWSKADVIPPGYSSQ